LFAAVEMYVCDLDIGITGRIVMDYKADRIMDYALYSLLDGDIAYKQVINVPMTTLSSNGTACSSWLVGGLQYLNISCLIVIYYSACV